MGLADLQLDPDPAAAVRDLREASRARPVLVFKHSPICPISHRAEGELAGFLGGLAEDEELCVARVDVIARRGLARGLTAELGVEHESPQALWFAGGELVWHASHGALTRKRFAELLSRA